jgi:hypothetical protein
MPDMEYLTMQHPHPFATQTQIKQKKTPANQIQQLTVLNLPTKQVCIYLFR